MIKRKKKECRHCKRLSFLKGQGLCEYCYNRKQFHKSLEKEKKAAKPIAKVSKKLKYIQNDYQKVRSEHLKEHPCCEVRLPGCSGCDKRLIQLHHKKGRIGELLTDKRYFLTVCMSCHKTIEENPTLAYENGWSLSRLEKD